MEEFNFEQLKNIEVPQSCIEKALKIPAESKKSASLVRLYRFAAGIAACVVIAAAVILSLMTGLNKNVDLTNPDPENPSRSDSVYNGTDPSSTDDISSPSILSPLLFGADVQGSTAVTEPAESSGSGGGAGGTKKSKQKSASTSNGNNKAQAPTKSKSNNGSSPQKPDEPGKTDHTSTEKESTSADKTEPETNVYTEPCADNPSTPTSASPTESKCYFETIVSSNLAEGDVYCRLEDEKGIILGNGGLYDKKRIANKQILKNGSVLISYVVDQTDAEKADGKVFTVIFYDSSGSILKQSNPVPIHKEIYVRFN